jgi:RimJ/RimL family protein N-acetyltransferase
MARIELPDPPLADGVVTLRGWRGSDVDDLYAACQDPEIPRWTLRIPWPYLIGHARDWVARQPDILRAGRGAHFAVRDQVTGRFLGGIGLDLSLDGRMPELGYWLAAHARGRGVATRAARLVTEWGLADLDLFRIDLRADEDNRASQRVAERAGFTPVRVVPGVDRHGMSRSFVLYSRSPGDRLAPYAAGRKSPL